MTTLKADSSVVRETATLYRTRPLVVRLKARHLEIREKGRRDTLLVDYAVLYDFAQKMRWRREQAEKREAKLARRGR